MPRRFGEIPGYPPGSWFHDRWELVRSGVHRPPQAGIAWTREGAESVLLAGGYEDDQDFGDEILYTGEGGNENGRQVRNQSLTEGNLALARTRTLWLPVRVNKKTAGGYRYEGLYRIAGIEKIPGRSGFLIWQFRLV